MRNIIQYLLGSLIPDISSANGLLHESRNRTSSAQRYYQSKRKVGLRNFIRVALSLFPQNIRYRVIRNFINVNTELPAGVTLKIAETESELSQAWILLHNSYVRENLMEKQSSGMRISRYHTLPSTSTLIVKLNDEVIATLSLIRDGAFGIPTDAIANLDEWRKKGFRLAEVSSLAISPSFRGNKGQILFPLLKFMYEYSLKYFGVDLLVISVHPKNWDFYEALLFFKKLSTNGTNKYDFVNQAPAISGILSLREAHSQFKLCYNDKNQKQNLFAYFVFKKLAEIKFPERKLRTANDPVLTPVLFKTFFIDQTSIIAEMTPLELAKIDNVYRSFEYRNLLPDIDSKLSALMQKQRDQRLDVDCPSQVHFSGGRESITARILDVSKSGFKCVPSAPIRFGLPVNMEIELRRGEFIIVLAMAVWSLQHAVYGFKILEPIEEWQRLIGLLEAKVNG